MLQTGEKETEILLGNKQLLAVFFVAAALLGIAFTGGYMLGRGSGAKKATLGSSGSVESTDAAQRITSANTNTVQGGETHAVLADDASQTIAPEATPTRKARRDDSEPLLGARKKKTIGDEASQAVLPKPAGSDSFVPQGGQEFVQVTALAHEQANGVAAALRKKGFRAHAVPKPGNTNLYRVVVGPIRDASELSSTRDALRKTGFRDVIIQRYE